MFNKYYIHNVHIIHTNISIVVIITTVMSNSSAVLVAGIVMFNK